MARFVDRLNEAIELATAGQLREAVELFQSLPADDPRDVVVLYKLGMCFTDLGSPGKAITALTQCLKCAPAIALRSLPSRSLRVCSASMTMPYTHCTKHSRLTPTTLTRWNSGDSIPNCLPVRDWQALTEIHSNRET